MEAQTITWTSTDSCKCQSGKHKTVMFSFLIFEFRTRFYVCDKCLKLIPISKWKFYFT